jgi:hypothetical protein
MVCFIPPEAGKPMMVERVRAQRPQLAQVVPSVFVGQITTFLPFGVVVFFFVPAGRIAVTGAMWRSASLSACSSEFPLKLMRKPFTVRFLDCSAIGEICEDVVVGERKPSATFVCLGECAQRSTIDVGLVVAQQIAGDVMTPERACR